MTKHKSEDYKISAVQYYLEHNKSQINTCKIFKCTPRSLIRWVNRYIIEKSVKRHNRKPISYKIRKIHVKFLIKEIIKNKTITMEDLLIKLKENFKDIELTRRHIQNIIKDNYITLKLTHIRHTPIKRFGKNININEKIKEFYNEIKKYKIEDIICIDESSINSLEKRKHCYSDKGKRCTIKTDNQEVFKKYTGIFAINYEKTLGWELYEKGGIDTERLYVFLEKYITTKYKNKLIILDNASCHRNEKIKELINRNNKLLYSVPYQHFTNAIENFFSMFKSKLRKLSGIKYIELKNNIIEVLNKIKNDKYKNILKGSYKRHNIFIPKSKIVRKFKVYKD